jgi:glutaredoxin
MDESASMTPADQAQVTAWARRHPAPIQLDLVLSDDERSAGFSRFADSFTQLATQVSFRAVPKPDAHPPAIRLAHNLEYRLVPTGKELPPFLDTLSRLPPSNRRRSTAPSGQSGRLELFVSLQCPHCPKTVAQASAAACESTAVELMIIDAELYPEAVHQRAIRAVPTVILDDRYRWSGEMDIDDILQLAQHPDLATAGPAALRAVLSAGRASDISDRYLAQGRLSDGIIDLLAHDKWPVRLGAMVVVETLSATAPELALEVVGPLWQRFSAAPSAVKIDMLHLLGEIGAVGALERIAAVAADGREDPSVGETAGEVARALESSRNG